MATWTEIKGYIFSNYKVSNDEGTSMTLVFDTGSGRSQLIFVGYVDLENPLLKFSSPVAQAAGVSADRVLEAASGQPFGVEKIGDFYALAHVQLADTVDGDEIDMPLALLTAFADMVEEKLGLGDQF